MPSYIMQSPCWTCLLVRWNILWNAGAVNEKQICIALCATSKSETFNSLSRIKPGLL